MKKLLLIYEINIKGQFNIFVYFLFMYKTILIPKLIHINNNQGVYLNSDFYIFLNSF